MYTLISFKGISGKIYKNLKKTTQLTWFSPPHSPAGSFAHKRSRSPLLPLSLFAAGLTSKLHRAHNTLIAYVDRFACNWHRLATTDLSCISWPIIILSCRNSKKNML